MRLQEGQDRGTFSRVVHRYGNELQIARLVYAVGRLEIRKLARAGRAPGAQKLTMSSFPVPLRRSFPRSSAPIMSTVTGALSNLARSGSGPADERPA